MGGAHAAFGEGDGDAGLRAGFRNGRTRAIYAGIFSSWFSGSFAIAFFAKNAASSSFVFTIENSREFSAQSCFNWINWSWRVLKSNG